MTLITTLLSQPNLKMQSISSLKRFSTGLGESCSKLWLAIAGMRTENTVVNENKKLRY